MQCGCGVVSPATYLYPQREIKVSASKLKTSAETTKTQIHKSPSDCSLGFRVPLPSHVKSITSTANPFVKHCLKLRHSSSYRHAHGSVIVVGATPIREICMFQESSQQGTTEMVCLLLHEEAEIPQGLDNLPARIVRVSSLVMKKLSGVQSTESVEAIALMRLPSSFIDLELDKRGSNYKSWFSSPHRILVLDGIQDPGNLGTLLRSAMAFKWCGAFLLPGCCDPFNDKALRASRGASFQLPIVSGNWSHLQLLEQQLRVKLLAGHPAITLKPRRPISVLTQELAVSLAEKQLCLVLGSEGHGLSEQSMRECELLSIPMAGDFDSLNVSVAGGIFMFMLQPSSS